MKIDMDDTKKLLGMLHPLEVKVVPFLKQGISFQDLIKNTGLKDVEVMRALQWLENKDVLKRKEEVREIITLGKNGDFYKKEGLPELRFLKAIKDKEKNVGAILKDAKLQKEELNICIGTLKKKAAILINKKDNNLFAAITTAGTNLLGKKSLEEKFLDKTFPIFKDTLKDEEIFAYVNLKNRKDIVSEDIQKTITVELTHVGKELLKEKGKVKDSVEKLNNAMLKDGSWKNKTFRRYDIRAKVPREFYGRRHFVNQAIKYIKKIWLEMGFEEMEGNLLQTGFWDLDALFVPQDHPAREMQDTFYVVDYKNPKNILRGKIPLKFENAIKETHENGWTTGSKGWGGKWNKELAEEVLMRTHTTVLSARTIANLKEGQLPKKFFSVNKVFRNEALDWKHLFEFYQVEGIVVDPNANLANLIGYLREFYRKMGYKDVRVRPSHFPYTEPSLEVEVLHPKKKEWVELGGAGIFRPEVVKPLLGKDIPVLAWGQGMERIILEYFKLGDLRDLYKNDLKQIREMKEWVRI